MDGDSGNKFLPAARASANNLASGASFRAEQIITSKDVAAAYHRDFITALALVSEDEAFEIRLKLKTFFARDFNTKEFDKRLKQEVSKLTPVVEYEDWAADLLRGDSGGPRAILANSLIAFRKASEWSGVLAYDEFGQRVMKLKRAPWKGRVGEWTDDDDSRACEWMQYKGIIMNTKVTNEAAQTAARDNGYHPVRAYLESLTWDDKKRIDTWLTDYLSVEDSKYSRAVGAAWLISGVARVFEPGCKADHCLILQGDQGIGKSQMLSALGGDWFTDRLSDFGSKDAGMELRGRWIVELAELDNFTRSEVSKIKQFIGEQVDRFRPPYGRQVQEFPRQCIFAGSVNQATFLKDETGARRFWPVMCRRSFPAKMRVDRDQIWAEAHARYKTGEIWHLTDASIIAEAVVQQDARYEGDSWDEIVLPWIADPTPRMNERNVASAPCNSSKDSISIAEVLIHCIGKSPDKWTQWDHIRVSKILVKSGYEKYREPSGDRRWLYRPRK